MIEQLEAVVEFYLNFRTPAAVATKIGDPWTAGAVPLDLLPLSPASFRPARCCDNLLLVRLLRFAPRGLRP